jgi:hypothetical protein
MLFWIIVEYILNNPPSSNAPVTRIMTYLAISVERSCIDRAAILSNFKVSYNPTDRNEAMNRTISNKVRKNIHGIIRVVTSNKQLLRFL